VAEIWTTQRPSVTLEVSGSFLALLRSHVSVRLRRLPFSGFDPDNLLVALDAGFSDEEIVYMFALDNDERQRAQAPSEAERCSRSSPPDGREAC
jgi:hypothetical protein